MSQTRIDGKPVWIIKGASVTGGDEVYHTHEDCSPAETRQVGLGQLGNMYSKCQYCRYEDGDRDNHPNTGNASGSATCPLCGDSYEWEHHIRHCAGGGK